MNFEDFCDFLSTQVSEIKDASLPYVTDMLYRPPHGPDVNALLIVEISGPPKSCYEDQLLMLQFAITPDYPAEPPLVRFTGMMLHSQLLPTGHLPPFFFAPENLDWNNDPKARSLLRILRQIYEMLSAPLKEVAPSDDELYHEWLHETKGKCSHKEPNHDAENVAQMGPKLRLTYPAQVQSRFIKYCNLHAKNVEVTKKYVPKRLYPQLFEPKGSWPEEWFEPSFWQLIKSLTPRTTKEELEQKLASHTTNVYVFPLFSALFCQMLRDEFRNFEAAGLPISRPNSMNNYGLIINDIGMAPVIDVLLAKFIRPLTTILFPKFGDSIDHHHSFIVQYRPDGDLALDMHTDDSELTINACISEEFEGGVLDFCGQRGLPNHRVHSEALVHRLGYGVLHLGAQRHGAREIKHGERDNLIIWFKSSTYRLTEEFQMHHRDEKEDTPDQICLSRTHDADYDFHMKPSKSPRKHISEDAAIAGATQVKTAQPAGTQPSQSK